MQSMPIRNSNIKNQISKIRFSQPPFHSLFQFFFLKRTAGIGQESELLIFIFLSFIKAAKVVNIQSAKGTFTGTVEKLELKY